MVDGKLKMYRLHTPPFYFGCRDFVNSSTAKRNATFTAHTHIRMYATLLNDELMNKTQKKYNTNIFTPRANRLYYIKYYGLLLRCIKQ